MDLGLKDKTVLVTGASKGIGLRIAQAFAEEGCQIGFCARTREDVDTAKRDLQSRGHRVTAVQADVREPVEAARFVDECLTELGAIDILVNNVGNGFGGNLMEGGDEDWKITFDTNLFQTVRMIRMVVPHMRKRGGGSIVNIASLSGWEVQMAGTGQYGSSKAAVIFLGERFALELVRDKIRVNTISPGAITWPGGYWDEVGRKHPGSLAAYIRDGLPMGRLGRPEEVADAVVFLASPRASWINGRNIPVDGLQQPVPLDYQRPY
jgi:NAD(P)-dependent dehydrogenase (short-subunit alcohol dehydrogenase family)